MYKCDIIEDNTHNGNRLTTFEVTYPLIIHAEIMTHRVFSRNVASNRAIPVNKLLTAVESEPFIPERFPKNQAGMQNSEWLYGKEADEAKALWLKARDKAVGYAKALGDLGVHKQITNRLLGPFLWTTAVITSTEWENFFALRCHPAAQMEIRTIAEMMESLYRTNAPKEVESYTWHTPYITASDVEWSKSMSDKEAEREELLAKISIGRCARVSYLNHGVNNTPSDDVALCERLIEAKHLSPTEHVALAMPSVASNRVYYGNFSGWMQYRKRIQNESGEKGL